MVERDAGTGGSMSMVDDTNRPVRSDERTASGMSGRTPNNDPLAELARLIGQDDPFRDARPDGGRAAPRREAPAQPYVEAPRSAPGWLARNSGAPAHDDPPPRYDDAHDAHDAQYESDARYQDDPRYGDPQYDAAAHQDGAQVHQAAEHDAGYDPAHGDDADHYYDDEGHYENYGETDEAPRRRSGLAIVVALVGLAVLGTGGVFAYRAFTGGSGSSADVPVVKAPDTPNKVVPPPQNANNQPGKEIYDRVTDKGGNEKIGTTPEEPVDVKGGNQRTGIPGLIQGVPPGGVVQQPPAPTQASGAPTTEPKKVKTVPIRPDQPTGATAVPPPRAPTTTPAPAPAPMRLANQTPAPPVRNTAVAGGFVVQVASQRSEADAHASYRALQTKYPTVLGDREAFVRKADLGDKGVFYRAQLGPFTTLDQANELCTSLKTAGGQCVVQKN